MALPLSYSIRSLWTRRLTTFLTASGMALVVFVFAAVLMLAEGLQKTLVQTGSRDNAIVLRKGATGEVDSSIERGRAAVIETLPGVAVTGNGDALLAKETVILITLLAAALRFVIIGWWVTSLPVLLFAQLLHALTFGAYHASAIGLVHRHFRGKNQARGQALYNSLAFGIGGSLGSIYSGAAWDTLGGAATFTLAGSLALAAALVFAWRGRSATA